MFQLVLFMLVAGNVEIYCHRHLQGEGFETPDGIARRDAVTLWRLKPGLWPSGNSTLYVNRDGIRNREVDGPPAPGVLRVMCLGGSVTYGSGVVDNETFPFKLEGLLQQMVSPGWTVEVVNAGVPGHNSYQCLSLYEDLAPVYRPHIVIPMWGFNDGVPSTMRRYRDQHAFGRWKTERALQVVRGWLVRSATYRYLGHRLLGRAVAPPVEQNDDEVADNLRYLDESATANGARVLFLFEAARSIESMERLSKEFNTIDPLYLVSRQPATVARLRAAYYRVVNDRAIPEVDMNAVLAQCGTPEDVLYSPGDVCHFSITGSTVVAGIIADKLASLRWLP